MTSNFDYIPSLMQTIETKMNQFFVSCADTRFEIDFDILDFVDKIKCIRSRKSIGAALSQLVKDLMRQAKKPTLSPPGAAAKKRTNHNAAEEPAAKAKRKKGGNTAIINTSPINRDWIRDDESFGIFYAHMSSAPKFDGTSICVKYHVRDSCPFDEDCLRRKTHTNAFDEKAKAGFDAWVKMCGKVAAEK